MVEALDNDIAIALEGAETPRGGGLPYALGLSRREGALWSEFVQLPPNRDLPSWVNDCGDGAPLLANERVGAFDRAHHLAAGWGLIADRVDDGQVGDASRFDASRAHLLQAWRVALAAACGDVAIANATVDDALAAWEDGVAIERAFFAGERGLSRVGEYRRSVRLRLRWVVASAAAMLETAGDAARAEALRSMHACFMLGLQCRDDAHDAEDDRALRGAAVHEVLTVPRGALVRAAPLALRKAAVRARAAGFSRMASWVSAFADEVDVDAGETDRARSELAAFVIVEGVA